MSVCVRINGLEHLPIEQTLLVHYTIGCTGLWDLAQGLTAYRNVCDDEWTLMFPNFQHPRHSDFPLFVGSPGYRGTFAWNYGGIQGVSPENFDQSHSYLIQLALFSYDCLTTGSPPTGQPSDPGTGSLPDPSGSSSGEPPRGPTGGGRPLPPGGGDPPVPGAPDPINFQWDPRNPTPDELENAWADPGPDPWVDYITPSGSGRFDIGSAYSDFPDVLLPPYDVFPPNPNNQAFNNPDFVTNPLVNNPLDVNLDNSINNPQTQNPIRPPSIFDQSSQQAADAFVELSRPTEPSLISPDRYQLNILSNDPAIPSPPSVPNNTTQITPHIDYTNQGSAGTIGINPAGHTNISPPNIKIDLSNNISIRQIYTSAILPGSFTYLSVNHTDIHQGRPVVIAGTFTPAIGQTVSVTANIYTLDSNGITTLVGSSSNAICSTTNPIQVGIAINTTNYSLGQLTIVLLILDGSTVIGTATQAVNILSPQLSNNSPRDKLTPTALANAGQERISNPFTKVNLVQGKNRYYMLSPTSSTRRISAAYIASNSSDRFLLQLIDASTLAFDDMFSFLTEIGIEVNGYNTAKTIAGLILAESSGPIITNNIEYFPNTHTVGVVDISTSGNVVLALYPLSAGPQHGGQLFISDSYELRPFAVTSASQTSITLSTPYVLEDLRLIDHGARSGVIPSNYTTYSSQSDALGNVTFSQLDIAEDHFYSIIEAGTSSFNPFKNIVYTNHR